MDKMSLLKERAGNFRKLLEQYEANSTDAGLLLKWLTPLFQEIEIGKIYPPRPYKFHNSLGKDSSFYEPDKPFHSAEAAFVAALEDWESQEWYARLKGNEL